MATMLEMLPLAAWVVAVAVLVVGLAVAYGWLRAALPAFVRFRGPGVVTCPETGRPAGVAVDALRAAATAFQYRPDLRLASCSRWPERQGCGQECLSQIEASPEDCLVRSVLTRWYAGKTCVYCGRAFDAIHWHDHKPALLDAAGRSLEWRELAPEQVPGALAADKPVCWTCHIAESFRREHPEWVTERPWQGADRNHRML